MRNPFLVCLLSLGATALSITVAADDAPGRAVEYLEQLNAYAHLELIDPTSERRVLDYLVPLGAIEKIRGEWSPRDSERYSGTRLRYTWRVLDGFDSAEVVEELDMRLADDDRAALVFKCEGRACGSSVQWANRIFQQRLLYGRDGSQRYRVYTFTDGGKPQHLLIYASARSTDRQYLHGELLFVVPNGNQGSNQ